MSLTWAPKMCERCKAKPAIICHGDDWDAPGGREQASAILCGECEASADAPPETFHCNDWQRVEALWLMYCAAPPLTAREIERADLWERETRHAGKAMTRWQG